MSRPHTGRKKKLQGIPVSAGIIIGKAHVVDREKVKILYQYLINDDYTQKEVERFKDAVQAAERQLTTLKNGMPDHVKEHVYILDSHMMILKDSMFSDATIRRIQEEKINAEWALKKSIEEIRDIFNQIDDTYISNRISDVENVAQRVFRNLSGKQRDRLGDIDQRMIIVAHDLSPADTTELNIAKVMGFITDVGGRTSHTAIMAQALEIPAVVALEFATDQVEEGDLLIVDGNSGEVIVNPDETDIIHYNEKQIQHEKYKSSVARTSHLPAVTSDGRKIATRANIEFLQEVNAAKEYGGE
jgi:phosphotransferase system enzyme I (PtsI)